MAVSKEFLRGVLGVIALVCAYMAGRSLVSVRQGRQKPSTLYAWLFRTIVCLAGVAFRHPVDTVDLGVWGLSAVVFGIAMRQAARQRPPEDLSLEIFPDEP